MEAWRISTPCGVTSGGQLDDFYGTTTRLWDDNVHDAFLQPLVLDYVQAHQPRVLFIAYGETDEWAHSGRYDLVLSGLHISLMNLWSSSGIPCS
jgi:hypothetical protein